MTTFSMRGPKIDTGSLPGLNSLHWTGASGLETARKGMGIFALALLVLQILFVASSGAEEPVTVSVRLFQRPGDKPLPTEISEAVKLAASGPSAQKVVHSGEETTLEFPDLAIAMPPKNGFTFQILPGIKGNTISVQLSVQIFEMGGYCGSAPINPHGSGPRKVPPHERTKFSTRKQPMLFLTTRLNEPFVVLIQSQMPRSNSADWRKVVDELLFMAPINRYAVIEFTKGLPHL